MEHNNRYYNTIIFILIGICIITIWFAKTQNDLRLKAEQTHNIDVGLPVAIDTTLYISKNKLQQETAKREALLIEYKQLQNLYSKKYAELKSIVDKNTQSATILSNQTKDSAATKTNVVYVKNDSMPEYITSWSDSNSTGTIRATKDSIFRNILVQNHLQIRQEWQGKFWQRKKLFTEVTNLNPNTNTTNIQTYVKQPKKQHPLLIFGCGIIAGVIVVKVLR